MTTIRQIIIDAYREGGLVQIGLTPEAEELDEGLRKIQTLISSLFGNEMGAPLTPVSFGDEGLTNAYGIESDVSDEISCYFVPSNYRLMANIGEPTVVFLDPNPKDGARLAVVDVLENFSTNPLTINGNGRNIEGASSIVLNTNGTNKQWFYRAELGEWVLVSTLAASSESPFPSEFDDFLITFLAIRLNPRYQAQTSPETIEEFQRMRRQFRARYKQVTEMRAEEALLRLPSSRHSIFEDLPPSFKKFDKGLFD